MTVFDFEATSHGSIIVLTPRSGAARTWIDDHVDPEAPRWCGGVAIELRCAGAVLERIEADGLTIR